MKLLTQLMDAYTHYIQLPLSLLNENGTIEHTHLLANRVEAPESLLELTTICRHIQKATIVSIASTEDEYELYYAMTPLLTLNGEQKFVIAGPFVKEERQRCDLPFFTSTMVEQLLLKMNALYDVLLLKSQAETRIMLPPQLIEVLQNIGDFEQQESIMLRIERIATEFLRLDAFDFFCVALKNNDDVFTVQMTEGDGVQKLAGKSFYLGEGLLGKSAILNTDFYWVNEPGQVRIDFLHRHGIVPTHVFGVPIQRHGHVIGVLFCGNFHHISIGEYLRQIIHCILTFVTQRLHIERELKQSSYIEGMFTNLLDLLDVLFNTSEIKLFAYKLLDFCEQIQQTTGAIMTLPTGEQLQRGHVSRMLQAAHHKHIQRTRTQVIEENELHIHFAHYGYVSIAFEDREIMQQMVYILTLLQMFIEKEYVLPQRDSIFHLLHTSMREMNREQYERTCMAVNMVEDVAKTLKWSETIHYVRNACYVLPYSAAYLSTHIRDTIEWQYIQEMHHLLEQKQPFTTYKAPVKVLAFIYIYVVQQQTHDLSFLDDALKDICMRTYANSTIPQRTLKSTIGGDVNDVIEKLSLTSREKEIVHLIVEGLNNHEVAAQLNISVHTVKNHVTNIFKKLNVSDRIQAMTKIYRMQFE